MYLSKIWHLFILTLGWEENIVELCLISLRKLFTSTCFLGLCTNTAWHIFVRITFPPQNESKLFSANLGWQYTSRIVWWSHLICLTLKGLRVPKGTLSSNGLHQVYLKWKMKIIGRDCKRKVKTTNVSKKLLRQFLIKRQKKS